LACEVGWDNICGVARICVLANLVNQAGLPPPTFRTDTWPLTGEGTLVIEKD